MCIFNATHGFAPPNAHLGCDLLLCLELLVNLVGPHHVHGAGDVGDRPALPHLSPVQHHKQVMDSVRNALTLGF